MKKTSAVLLAVAAAMVLSGCADADPVQTEATGGDPVQTEVKISSTVTASSRREETASSRTLIAYFTWADNAVVEDETAAVRSALEHYESIGDSSNYTDVDAVSSASVVQPGNVAQMAGWIQAEIGGDLFSIQATNPYPSDYDACMDRASKERADQARPELTGKVEHINDYDVVAIGYSNWWSGVPAPVLSFIDENDLSGKKIILFCSHGTGGLARTVREITKELPKNCELEKNVLGIYRAEIPAGQPKVQQWLTEIGYERR